MSPPPFRSSGRTAIALASVLLAGCASDAGRAPLYAPAPVTFDIAGEPLTLRSPPWFAGAVSSVRFRGVEFVDAADHGRLMQGAIAFGGLGECLNPTQAGASRDRPGRSTTSRLLWAGGDRGAYRSATRMAYWKRPGEPCTPPGGSPRRAANRSALSDVVFTQAMTPGYGGRANAVLATVSFTTARERPPAVVEALTIYAPAAFERFLVFRDGALAADAVEQPGEQPLPAVVATADGGSAIGLFSPAAEARYGRFAFPGLTSKINVVHRPTGSYPAGRHDYQVVWILGTLAEVEATLRALQPQ